MDTIKLHRTLTLEADGACTGTIIPYNEIFANEGMRYKIPAGAIKLRRPVICTLQHTDDQILASENSGLVLTDDQSRLGFRLRFPDAGLADVQLRTQAYLKQGLLTGASAEILIVASRRGADQVNVITAGQMSKFSLVDVPAIRGATLDLARWDADGEVGGTLELARGKMIRGFFPWGVPYIVSAVAMRKRVIRKGADITLADDIALLDGDYGKPLASSRAGSLTVNLSDDGLRIAVSEKALKATPDGVAFLQKMNAGVVKGFVPNMMIGSSTKHTDADGFEVEVIDAAMFCEAPSRFRGHSKDYPGRLFSGRRRRSWQV